MNEMYETPEIEITEVNVEKGFAATGTTGSYTEDVYDEIEPN